MSFMRGNAVSKMRLLVRAGVIDKPVWLEALEMAPPLPVPKVEGKVPKLVLEEDPLVQSYYSRFPRAKYLEPFRVNSFDPPLSRVYAWRQIELMEHGYSRMEARKIVDEEIKPLQEEEEEEVLDNFREVASKGGESSSKGDILEEIFTEDLEVVKHGLRERDSQEEA
eukprot:TRINITY_DN6982_c0_g1_i1.p1 TRINITY_DN6982_c0_g1~~TRINITY_DN6982_c0_g1_i1.p1  ORF type:complete len:167 (-),score=44.33 TRINITY_DN6982_c0_g1_i1:90-590(-)